MLIKIKIKLGTLPLLYNTIIMQESYLNRDYNRNIIEEET